RAELRQPLGGVSSTDARREEVFDLVQVTDDGIEHGRVGTRPPNLIAGMSRSVKAVSRLSDEDGSASLGIISDHAPEANERCWENENPPFGPSRPKISPSRTEKVTPASA